MAIWRHAYKITFSTKVHEQPQKQNMETKYLALKFDCYGLRTLYMVPGAVVRIKTNETDLTIERK